MRPAYNDPNASSGSIGSRERRHPNIGTRNEFQTGLYGNSTIRTVTPDSLVADAMNSSQSRANPEAYGAFSSPASPHGLSHDSAQSSSRQQRLRAGSNNDLGPSLSTREQHLQQSARPRTRTLDNHPIPRETSPPSGYMRNSIRMGSSNSMSIPHGVGVEDVVTSIGHPSTIPQPSFTSTKRKGDSGRKLGKLNHTVREAPIHESSASNVRSPSAHVFNPEHRSDMRKILELMKSSCGKMEGQLAFRRFETIPWSLSYCSINDEAGSLVYEPKSTEQFYRTLIPDLRGCHIKTMWDSESRMPYLEVCPQNSKLRVHLRPHSQDEFDSWFAALLCWQPIRPKGAQNRMTKPQISSVGSRKLAETRRHSEQSLHMEAPVIKFGKMIYWNTAIIAAPDSTVKPATSRREQELRRWQPVSCQLRENGEMTLHSEQDMSLITTIHLSQLSRSAIQRLDASVLDTQFCIAIYPQYAAVPSNDATAKPVYVSVESRIVFEAWLVLLRAFTVPQLYGPKEAVNGRSSQSSATNDMFRMERSLSLTIVEARLVQPLSPRAENAPHGRSESNGSKNNGGYYVEALLDGEVRARTMIKAEETASPFWREEFDFGDLPAPVSVASIVLRRRLNLPQSGSKTSKDDAKKLQNVYAALAMSSGSSETIEDDVHGCVDIFVDDLESGKPMEKWWPLVNQYGQSVGEILVKVTVEESIILMANDYKPMSELLHRFANSLTLQIAQRMPAELKRLSECLLNIFQVSGSAIEWLNSLVEEEIDGTLKEAPVSRVRYPTRRMSANETGDASYSPRYDRELMMRDMGKNATVEANLLFRANTLLTKSLDLHMKRLGKDYLEETLGDKLREIAAKDPDCEVDPNRISNQNDMDRNWRRLLHYTEQIWYLIATSVQKCPNELRYIFRHIRACADDRYGDFLRSVSYSSVSGFLFLRFFVPAVLNPKLFGLYKEFPPANTRRTLTLIAKSLQGLGNMTTFGAKEEWMEAMNSFLTNNRSRFKTFIDTVCDVPSTHIQVNIPPPYLTPLNILQRLPPTSREGFPSLPHLIDHAKSFATLVTLWLDHCGNATMPDIDNDLTRFHQQCLMLRMRTDDSLVRAERAERPSSQNSMMYEELIEQMESGTSSTSATIVDDATSYHRMSLSAGQQIERPGTSAATMHSRKDSFGAKPSLGSRSTSGGPDSSLTMRQWRGPGRQLSLEILPTIRPSVVARDAPPPVKASLSAGYNPTSPVSNTTSPYGGSSNSPADPEELGRRSGRTTPSRFARHVAEVTGSQHWGYGHPTNLAMIRDLAVRSHPADSDSSKDRSSKRTESRNGGTNPYTDKSRASSEASNPHLPESRGNDTESSAYSGNAGWSGEKVFKKSSSSRGTPSHDASPRHKLRERAEQLEPGESHPSFPLQQGSSSSIGNNSRPSSSARSQRVPRRDWTPDERAKRDERTHGIVSAMGSTRLHGSRAVYTGSAENSSGEEAYHHDDGGEYLDDEEETTALPRFTPQQHAQILAQAHEKVAQTQMQREGSKDRGDKDRHILAPFFKKRKN